MDERVRRSWQLQPDQIEIKNPSWQTGMDQLSVSIASRLGCKGIPLRCVLYKVLVYGEGGHFLKHQDTEKEDGMVATLVVQPPSTHEGGDLVVYRGEEELHRHDFGKMEGTAAFSPHYAVHYADAEHALEEVTKGFRLALVYSICLPDTMRHLKRDSNTTMCDELAGVINGMEPQEKSFAMLLSHEYTKKSIGDLGSGALKGIDGARFRTLEEANTRVSPDKQLRFFLAKLSIKIGNCLDEDRWHIWDHQQAIHWYTPNGEDFGRWENKKLEQKLNFLNPGRETFLQLWKSFGSTDDVFTGNEGPIKMTKYHRFAIIAWPATRYFENVIKFMSAEIAAEAFVSCGSVDAAVLRSLLDTARVKHYWGKPGAHYGQIRATVRFCRSFCELLAGAGDLELVKLFFSDFCPQLSELTGNDTLIPSITKIARAFGWSDIGDVLLNVLGNKTKKYEHRGHHGLKEMELLLLVASGLDDANAQRALLQVTIEKDFVLRSTRAVEFYWKHVVCPGGKKVVATVASQISQKQPSELGPFVEVFSQYIGDIDAPENGVLEGVAKNRIQWLRKEIKKLDVPFSWEMPYAEEPEFLEIERFLRGPERSMTTVGVVTFTAGVNEAQAFVDMRVLKEASYTTEIAGGEEDVYVTITKTRKWYDESRLRLAQYKIDASTRTVEKRARGLRLVWPNR